MQIAVLGAGTMGHGIAQVFAMSGHSVRLYDIDEDIVAAGRDRIETNLDRGIEVGKVSNAAKAATLDNLTTTTDLTDAVDEASFVIEAVPEEVELKREVLARAERDAPTDAIIASNTSSISITQLTEDLKRPDQAIGLHFWNPVHLIDFLEIPLAARTSDKTLAFVRRLVEDDLEFDYEVVNDYPGFASSRLGVALGVEAMRMVAQGVASPAAIDNVMTKGYNYSIGPLEQSDLAGLDVRLDILEYLREQHGERFCPPQILRRKVQSGKTGQKSGEGFYVWDGDTRLEVSDDHR
ncbi:3-hydroxyacyl-CoA dehydrogenase family protein [Halomarina salina]|uniref:3-hydroxyacyl-CoA dehydrogenase family protein n=1 Tax=Halomarina salina TaxID=1872699 RepID=A0ABD5RU53_9EURY|nr:3-hydroxyacyl-CoA dehydrogenase family protein [Halomarina salina]